MALDVLDYALLSTIAYSDDVEHWPEDSGDQDQANDFQGYIQEQVGDRGDLYENPWIDEETGADTFMTTDEWQATVCAAADSEGLSGFQVGYVNKNPFDGSEMIYLYNEETGEACFVFEGTSSSRGWFEDGRILAPGDTISQSYAIAWAKSIMDANDAEGKDFTYSACGHSKGGSQAVALTLSDPCISACYSFDGPGDDVEREEDARVHCYNNENDPVSPVLFPCGKETLLRGMSPDPNHAKGIDGAHSPSNLYNYEYEVDEKGNRVLVLKGLGEDVTSEGGAWYRRVIRWVTQYLGQTGDMREPMSVVAGLILKTVMNDKLKPNDKIRGVIEIVISHPLATVLLLGTVITSLAVYGVKRTTELLVSFLNKASGMVIDALITLGQAVEWAGEQLSAAIDYVTGVIASFVTDTWDKITSWVSGAIDWGKKFVKDAAGFFENLGKAIVGLFGGGPKVYDFSSHRIDQLKGVLERARAVDCLNPFSWDGLYAGAAFMARLSLGSAQSLLRSVVLNEWDVAGDVITKVSGAFELAFNEDKRYSGELTNAASGVRSAAAMLA